MNGAAEPSPRWPRSGGCDVVRELDDRADVAEEAEEVTDVVRETVGAGRAGVVARRCGLRVQHNF
jgi:hypothetical protein